MIFLILGLLVGGITVIFISQNIIPVTVFLFNWEIHGSLSLVLIVSILIGAVLAVLSFVSEMIDNSQKISNLETHIKALEGDNKVLKERISGGSIL
jgi:uncharacterized integral membrane protein